MSPSIKNDHFCIFYSNAVCVAAKLPLWPNLPKSLQFFLWKQHSLLLPYSALQSLQNEPRMSITRDGSLEESLSDHPSIRRMNRPEASDQLPSCDEWRGGLILQRDEITVKTSFVLIHLRINQAQNANKVVIGFSKPPCRLYSNMEYDKYSGLSNQSPELS